MADRKSGNGKGGNGLLGKVWDGVTGILTISQRLENHAKLFDEKLSGIGKRLDEMRDSDKEMRGILISTSNMAAATNAGNEKIEKRLDNLSGRLEKLEGALIDRGVSRQRN
ncbi:hypothetical protein [Candidatus Binatus sp.]|uniref:hypothetical protein n=1 Tax=Candidatus Binatus sp. TaxID=2811406 RepID=UPI003C40EDA8